MFNLLVNYSGWGINRELLMRSRVFEYTSEELRQQFKPNDELNVEALMHLPTLFVTEIGGSGNQFARVGTINRIRDSGTKYQVDYTYDAMIGPIANSKLKELSAELEIEEYELWRTHWAIKDVDLFHVLIRNVDRTLSPRVFTLSDKPVDESLVSIMMPFHAGFDGVYRALKDAVQGMGKRCERVDDIWHHDAIIEDVVSLICESDIVLCDLSDKNANVFYETGIAHTLGKKVILITQSADDVPFDLRHLRYIKYLSNGEGLVRLANDVRGRIETLDAGG